MQLDPTEQRILGVLIEKELSVPDSYPLTENALLAGCNQKSNRDPVLALEDFQLSGALASMVERRVVLRVSQAGSRTVRFKHQCEERLGLDGREKAVLAELLLRGPQAPGALKPRLVRMGMSATPAEILAVLEGLRSRVDGALVEQLPRQPRERDQRWRHRLGADADASDAGAMPRAREPAVPEQAATRLVVPETAMPTVPAEVPAEVSAEVSARIEQLERQVAELREELRRLRERSADAERNPM